MKIRLLLFLLIPSCVISAPSSTVNYLASLSQWSLSCPELERKGSKNSDYDPLLRKQWQHVCQKWQQEEYKTELTAKDFFELHFKKYYEIDNALITGYYGPIFHACRQKKPDCDTPILGLPKDKRLKKLSRQQINQLRTKGFPILAWTSKMDRFFLQVQGSGELVFNNGNRLYIGYAGKNNLPYNSIGKYLHENHLIKRKELNMAGIRDYLKSHPEQQQTVFESNPSFVFFKAKTSHQVIGNLGVELKSTLSAAVDNKWIPLGTMIEVKTTDPFYHKPWNLLLTAQDTGGAIRGKEHIDIYMGKGEKAGYWAGNMKETGKITYYMPK